MNKFVLPGITHLIVIILVSWSPAAFSASAIPAAQHPGMNGLHKAEQRSKVGSTLLQTFLNHRAHLNQTNKSAFKPANGLVQYANGRVLIEARATHNGSQLLTELQSLGLTKSHQFGDMISGQLPLTEIDKAAALTSLRSISASLEPIRHAGSITSQGDVALAVDTARNNYGLSGNGITVGVLSDSYDILGGASDDITSGDLPLAGAQVVGEESSLCGTSVYCIDEGRAMLQIVHDLAPGADLMFSSGMGGKAEYASAISSLATAGADVIVDDLLYLNEPMFQDGIVAQAVDAVVGDGVAYYSAAGNAGRASYESDFNDSGEIFCIEFFLPIGDCDPTFERVGIMHDFDPGPGVDLYQSITVPENGVLTIALQWDEPFGGAGPSTDYDIVLLDSSGDTYIAISANDNVSMGEGWEVLQFENADVLYYGNSFNLIITYDDVDSRSPPANLMKMVVFGSANTLNEWRTNSSTLFGHANADNAQAVGAAFFMDTPAFGTTPALLESYSSAGGTPIIFASNGSKLAASDIRQKPEITAVDGVNTTFFFNDSYGNDGVDDFFGTSAAAPHAAAIAALMLEASPGSTPGQVNSALENSAIDMNTPGFDYNSGYGLIQADAAIAALLSGGGNAPPTAEFDTSITGLGVTFTDQSSDSDGNIASWSWNFGDGNTAIVQNPTHSYAASGTYTVTLTVTDNGGRIDSSSKSVTVSSGSGNALPVAGFAYTCGGRNCSFDASNSTDDGGIVAYAWDFGDGNTSSAQITNHSYTANGNYTVTLTVTDAESAADSASATFRIKNRGGTSGTAGGGGDSGGGDGGTTIETEKGRKKCRDGIDNDGDGLIDAADPDC
ncbi:MAG: PKD domain-containing protein [Gammaproteobacteria bacterium]|nr:PKD domain-containing protein [Gammaproteobacteria bacterium]